MAAEDVTNIVELVARFRKPNANESLEDIAKRAWGVLHLQGETSLTSFEAFLIEAISLHVSSESGEEGALTRDGARKRDLALLAFGLLEDYYHTEHRSDGEHYVPVNERRMKYLRTSDYLELNYPGKYSKDDISKGRRFAPWGTITQSDSRCQRDLAKYLTIAVSGFLIKLGIGFLADVWVGLVIIAAAICLGVAGYRIYKFWQDTRP